MTDQLHEYLYGAELEVYTDNNPLTYILTSAKLNAGGQCWVVGLANYNFHILYKSRKSNIGAGALSRILWSSCGEDCNHLDSQAVKTIMVGSTIEASLFQTYQSRAIIAKSLHTNATEDLLFSSKENAHNIEKQKITRDK